MHAVWVILIVLICLFLFICYTITIFAVGFFFPAGFYSDSEVYFVWKNGYMPMLKDMKKYYIANQSFRKYNFKAALKNYMIKAVDDGPIEDTKKKNK